ncbi:UNVERIFIED_CONTAM: hypothetical protein FKN15_055177 [Acipenser sinensis]
MGKNGRRQQPQHQPEEQQPRCYCCAETGHSSTNCPWYPLGQLPQLCLICGGEHYVARCPVHQEREEQGSPQSPPPAGGGRLLLPTPQQQLQQQPEEPENLFPWCGKVDHRWRDCSEVPPSWCGRCEEGGHDWSGCPYASSPVPRQGEHELPMPGEEPLLVSPSKLEGAPHQSPAIEGDYTLLPPSSPGDYTLLPPSLAGAEQPELPLPLPPSPAGAEQQELPLPPQLPPAEGECLLGPLPPAEGQCLLVSLPRPPSSPPRGEEQELPLPPSPPGEEVQELPLSSQEAVPGLVAGIPQQPLHSLLRGAQRKTARPQRLQRGPALPQPLPQWPTTAPRLVLTPAPPKDACLASPKDACLVSPKDACLASPKDACLASPGAACCSALPGAACCSASQQEVLWLEPHLGELPATKKGQEVWRPPTPAAVSRPEIMGEVRRPAPTAALSLLEVLSPEPHQGELPALKKGEEVQRPPTPAAVLLPEIVGEVRRSAPTAACALQEVLWPEPHKRELLATKKGGGQETTPQAAFLLPGLPRLKESVWELSARLLTTCPVAAFVPRTLCRTFGLLRGEVAIEAMCAAHKGGYMWQCAPPLCAFLCCMLRVVC